jgi:xylulokinase
VDPGIVGRVGAEAARTFGVPAGTLVVLALGDAGSATDGTVGSEPGDVYLHLGTTGWVAHVDPTPAARLPLPEETGETVDRHRLAHPAGHLAIARLPEAGEALARARRDLLDLTDPHSPGAHAIAEAALAQPPTSTSARAATPDGAAATRAAAAYGEVVEALAADVAALLERLGARPTWLPATGGVVRSPMVRQFIEQAVGVPVDVMGVGGLGGARSAAGSGGELTLTASDAGLLSCARVAFDALGVEHTVTPLAARR